MAWHQVDTGAADGWNLDDAIKCRDKQMCKSLKTRQPLLTNYFKGVVLGLLGSKDRNNQSPNGSKMLEPFWLKALSICLVVLYSSTEFLEFGLDRTKCSPQ